MGGDDEAREERGSGQGRSAERLGQALRENLLRRKAQQRGRATAPDPRPDEADAPPHGDDGAGDRRRGKP